MRFPRPLLAPGKGNAPITMFTSPTGADPVPLRYQVVLRRVYHDFLQLTAFMGMNLSRHLESFKGICQSSFVLVANFLWRD